MNKDVTYLKAYSPLERICIAKWSEAERAYYITFWSINWNSDSYTLLNADGKYYSLPLNAYYEISKEEAFLEMI